MSEIIPTNPPALTGLYRKADTPNPETWNLPFEYAVFADADVEDAQADGWMLAADALASLNVKPETEAKASPYAEILAASVAEILPLLDTSDVEELKALRAEEAASAKPRAGLLTAIDKAIAAKSEN